MKTKKLFTTAAFCAAILFPASFTESCTGITLRATNGDVVFCRTLVWAAVLSHSFAKRRTPRSKGSTIGIGFGHGAREEKGVASNAERLARHHTTESKKQNNAPGGTLTAGGQTANKFP